MKFNEMKEMEFADWNGTPFEAYRCNNCDSHCDGLKTKIVSYVNGKWVTKNGIEWLHVYPVDLNKEKPKRMTNRQLAMWLAKGNGQMMYLSHGDLSVDNSTCLSATYYYVLSQESFECNDRIRVRKWDSEEWVEPTIDLL